MRKRAVGDESPGQETPTVNTVPATVNTEPEPSNQTDYVYYPGDQSAYKILLYTSSPPRIFDGKNSTYLDNSVPLTITTDRRNPEQRTLKVRYNYKEKVCRYSHGGRNLVVLNRTNSYLIFSWRLNMYSMCPEATGHWLQLTLTGPNQEVIIKLFTWPAIDLQLRPHSPINVPGRWSSAPTIIIWSCQTYR